MRREKEGGWGGGGGGGGVCVFFFFKQKTAYEIYQCDWSSDVCSSDLSTAVIRLRIANVAARNPGYVY